MHPGKGHRAGDGRHTAASPLRQETGVASSALRDWIPIQGASCPRRRAGFWTGTEKTKQTSKQTKTETTKTNKPKTGSPCDIPKRDLDAKAIGFEQQK